MHHNIWWRLFLCLVAVLTIGYSAHALYKYYVYTALSSVVQADQLDWHIDQRGESEFLIEATYHYHVKEVVYTGKSAWEGRKLLNLYAAQQAIEDAKEELWDVWYSPKDPSWSSLQRDFPLKEIFSSFLLWGITLYFIWIGFRIGNRERF